MAFFADDNLLPHLNCDLDLVVKAKGEGSRGGKVVGHTKAGRAKYAPSTRAGQSKPTHQATSEQKPDGKTQSGKPLYHSFRDRYSRLHEDWRKEDQTPEARAAGAAEKIRQMHPTFTSQDHLDAARFHSRVSNWTSAAGGIINPEDTRLIRTHEDLAMRPTRMGPVAKSHGTDARLQEHKALALARSDYANRKFSNPGV